MSASKKVKVRTEDKIRVLIADSDGQSSRRTLNFLTQHGFEVRFCPNGNEAKKALSNWKPKLILVDLLLPEANAFELLEYCKRDPHLRGQHVSFLIMSGHNSAENVREAYQRGARDYIARPFMYQDLLNRVVFTVAQIESLTLVIVQKKVPLESQILSFRKPFKTSQWKKTSFNSRKW